MMLETSSGFGTWWVTVSQCGVAIRATVMVKLLEAFTTHDEVKTGKASLRSGTVAAGRSG